MSLSDREPFPTMQWADPVTIPCRFCRNASPGRYLRSDCLKYEDKPDSVYYDSAPCPFFEEGRDQWEEEPANEGRAKP